MVQVIRSVLSDKEVVPKASLLPPETLSALHTVYESGLAFADGDMGRLLASMPALRRVLNHKLARVEYRSGFDPMAYLVLTDKGREAIGLAPQRTVRAAIAGYLQAALRRIAPLTNPQERS